MKTTLRFYQKFKVLFLLLCLAIGNYQAQTWTAVTSGTTQTLNAVTFASVTHGWAVGNAGTILATTDGGLTWTAQNSGTTSDLNGVSFISTTEGWAAGKGNTIRKTTNGGLNWTIQSAAQSAIHSDICFISATTGFVCNSNSSDSHSMRIYKTGNGGDSWINGEFYRKPKADAVASAAPMASIQFLSATTGWVAGNDISTSGGSVYRTTAGGTNPGNWRKTAFATKVEDLFFISATKGWIIHSNGIIRTSNDGGETWVDQVSGLTSGGDIHFISETTGWATDANGKIITTIDGGATWTVQTTALTAINGIHFVSENFGAAVGANGLIMRYGIAAGDVTPPTLAITSTASGTTSLTSIPMTLTFSEGVTGFAAEDITVTNGTVSNFSGSGTTYTFDLIPTSYGPVTVNVAAGVAQDAALNGNTVANQFSITYACANPTAFAVTGTGSYCTGGTGIEVGLAGSETDVTYQLNGGTAVEGTGSAITFGIQTAGTYTVLATRTEGACTATMTGNAVITVTSGPAITAQTGDITVQQTATANFSVTATGTDLTYRWHASYDNGTNYLPLTDGTFGNLNFTGAATAALAITGADNTINNALFRCVITGGTCTSTSTAAKLTVNPLAKTKLEAIHCDQNLASMATKINAIGINGATKYRFKVINGSTTFETAPSTARYFYIGAVTNVKYETTYDVSVQYQFNNQWSEYGATCTVTTPASPVSPKLEDAFCDKTLATMGTKINAIGITGATNYRFRVTLGETSFETTPSTSRYFYIGVVPNVKYGTTYKVAVQYQYEGDWADYGDECAVTTPAQPASPKLEDAFCDKTLTTYATKISAVGITAATAYRFKITLGESSYETTPSASRSFYMNVMPGVKYATTYEVRVQYEYDNDWVTYGDPCNITTPAKPIATLEAASCDVTLASMATKINATGITSATHYRFKVTLGETTFETPASTSRYFYISAVPNVKYATKYAVQTEYLYEDKWSTFGPECYITTPERPVSTQLEAASCDVILPTMTTKVNAVGIVAATMYRFKITLGETSYETTPSKSRFFYMSSVPNVENGTTYSVQAQYLYEGIWSEYATACDVTTPTIEKKVIDATKEPAKQGITLALTAYPNPTKASFKLKADFESDELVAISVYDITGRQLETITVKPYEVETLEFGKDYINGVYQVVMTQNEVSSVVKVVKE